MRIIHHPRAAARARHPQAGRRGRAIGAGLALSAIAGVTIAFSPTAAAAAPPAPFGPAAYAPAPIDLAAHPATVSKGGYLDLTATARTATGVPLRGAVTLQRNDHGRWAPIGSAPLSLTGVGRFRFKIWNPHTFRAIVAATAAPVSIAVSKPVRVRTVFDDAAFARAVVADAATRKGAPYVWATAGPKTFDCSGLVKYVFARYGVNLPHHADDMKHYGTQITRAQARPGDLVFAFDGRFAHHVAIYAGGGTWWEAPHTGAYVQHVKLRGRHLAFRRITPTDHAITW